MDIFKIAIIGICGMILSSVVKGYKPELSIYIVIATVLILFGTILHYLSSVFELFDGIYGQITYGKTFFPIIIKVLVVGYIADFSAQLCKDAGEGSIAGKVELAGKVIIFYLSIPIMMSLIELVNKLLPA